MQAAAPSTTMCPCPMVHHAILSGLEVHPQALSTSEQADPRHLAVYHDPVQRTLFGLTNHVDHGGGGAGDWTSNPNLSNREGHVKYYKRGSTVRPAAPPPLALIRVHHEEAKAITTLLPKRVPTTTLDRQPTAIDEHSRILTTGIPVSNDGTWTVYKRARNILFSARCGAGCTSLPPSPLEVSLLLDFLYSPKAGNACDCLTTTADVVPLVQEYLERQIKAGRRTMLNNVLVLESEVPPYAAMVVEPNRDKGEDSAVSITRVAEGDRDPRRSQSDRCVFLRGFPNHISPSIVRTYFQSDFAVNPEDPHTESSPEKEPLPRCVRPQDLESHQMALYSEEGACMGEGPPPRTQPGEGKRHEGGDEDGAEENSAEEKEFMVVPLDIKLCGRSEVLGHLLASDNGSLEQQQPARSSSSRYSSCSTALTRFSGGGEKGQKSQAELSAEIKRKLGHCLCIRAAIDISMPTLQLLVVFLKNYVPRAEVEKLVAQDKANGATDPPTAPWCPDFEEFTWRYLDWSDGLKRGYQLLELMELGVYLNITALKVFCRSSLLTELQLQNFGVPSPSLLLAMLPSAM